jgi:hypothetical protein
MCWFRIPDRYNDLFPEVMNVYLTFFALRKFSTYLPGTYRFLYCQLPIKVILLRRVRYILYRYQLHIALVLQASLKWSIGTL